MTPSLSNGVRRSQPGRGIVGRRGPWLVFGLGSLAAVAALFGLSRALVQRERAQRAAEAEANHHEDLRTALYRMDQRVAPLFARGLGRLDATALFLPGGAEISVQVWDLDLATGRVARGGDLASALREELIGETATYNPLDPASQVDSSLVSHWREDRGQARSGQDYNARQGINALNNMGLSAEDVDAGPLVPRWDASGPVPLLLLARRITTPSVRSLQVLRVEWPALSALLLAEIVTLFPAAALERIAPEDTGEFGERLAAVPARLIVTPVTVPSAIDGWTWTTLGAVWTLAFAALAAAGFAMRASVAYGDRHRRFTSAVTHELRTPLTTFRLYSEMLAKGMVPEESRAEYLRTLESESERLAALVENVLAYARLEDGRGPAAREVLTAPALVARHLPDLERRCAAADVTLAARLDDAARTEVRTDPDAVGQILLNLVDNACKYGCLAPGATVYVEARPTSTGVELIVRDEGPGVPAALARDVFRPFERGGRDEADPAPGVGLGLALSRDLARALGGALELRESERGACFALHLPTRG